MPEGKAPLETAAQLEMVIDKSSDRKALLNFVQKTYQELRPGADLHRLRETVYQLWSEHNWFWVACVPHEPEPCGCLWLGSASDPLTGDGCPHIFLLYVDLKYRHQGIGSALVRQAEQWSLSKGYGQIGIQVFTENLPALSLYQKLGYETKSMVLQKKLTKIS